MAARKPVAIVASEAAPHAKVSGYPEPYYSRVLGRQKRALGEIFGLRNFGVNLTRIAPGGISALRHAHSAQDEFIYVLEGEPVLVTDAGETQLKPGMCAGFKAGAGDAHHLINRTSREIWYLEIGDRSVNDAVVYPDDDLAVPATPDGRRVFTHKDGTPY